MIQVGLLGIPHDEYSSFMKGPAEAPACIRRDLQLRRVQHVERDRVRSGCRRQTRGSRDIAFDGASDPWDVIERDVGRALDAGGPLICLGGDHAITHPILRAVRRRRPRLTILHVDAPSDIYHAYQGNPRSHASPFARIMEEQLADADPGGNPHHQ